MATMLDVSIRAGVSKATVSRVLNGTGQVKESTRQQVFKAMEELGYSPISLPARWPIRPAIVSGWSSPPLTAFTLAVCCSRRHARPKPGESSLSSPTAMIRRSAKRKRCRCSPTKQCDAIILYTRHMSEKAIMSLINSIAMPLVVINRDVAQARERCVFFEQQEAAFQAVEYLITQGHRDIACITVPMHTPT